MRDLPKKLDQLLRLCVHRFHHDRLGGRLWLRLAFDRLCKEKSFLRMRADVFSSHPSICTILTDNLHWLVLATSPLALQAGITRLCQAFLCHCKPARGKANRKMCINRIFALSASTGCSPSFPETKVVNVDEETAGGFCQLELPFSVLDRRMLSKYSSVKVGSA
jgi:hypothetical protein